VCLIQLFQNLISNATKYRSKEPPRIEISYEQTNDAWLFGFTDNGIGIEWKDSQRVFALFKRLHRAETSGTGVGLAICQKIVERYGGQIWIDSEPDKGTTFWFTLPLQTR
jgi:signal transduction histidine kinase